MAKDRNNLADSLSDDNPDGWLTGFLADENEFDRRMLLRLGAWGLGAVGALTLAILASQSYSHERRDKVAFADLAQQQSQHIQQIAQNSRAEMKRLESAIDTLNSDRDRLFARVTTLEQNLNSVTGSIARQAAQSPDQDQGPSKAAAPDNLPAKSSPPAAAPMASIDPPAAEQASTPPPIAGATPVVGASSNKPGVETALTAAGDATAGGSATASESAASGSQMTPTPASTPAPAVASTPDNQTSDSGAAATRAPDALAANAEIPDDEAKSVAEVAVPRTEFGVDLGGAASLEGLRALWRRVTKSSRDVADLQPVIGVREHNGKLQLRLVAGPLDDAATAARICAALAGHRHACQTSVFDGQRLALNPDPPPPPRQLHRKSLAHTPRTSSASLPKPRPAPPPTAVERAN